MRLDANTRCFCFLLVAIAAAMAAADDAGELARATGRPTCPEFVVWEHDSDDYYDHENDPSDDDDLFDDYHDPYDTLKTMLLEKYGIDAAKLCTGSSYGPEVFECRMRDEEGIDRSWCHVTILPSVPPNAEELWDGTCPDATVSSCEDVASHCTDYDCSTFGDGKYWVKGRYTCAAPGGTRVCAGIVKRADDDVPPHPPCPAEITSTYQKKNIVGVDGELFMEMRWDFNYSRLPEGCGGTQSSIGAHGFGTFQCEYPNGDVCHGKIRPKDSQLTNGFECPPNIVSSWDDVRLFCGQQFDCGGRIFRTDCVQCADETKDEYWTEGTFMCFVTSNDEQEEVPACVGAVDGMHRIKLELPPCPADIDSCSDDDYLAECEDPFDKTEELACEHRENKMHKDVVDGLESYLGILELNLEQNEKNSLSTSQDITGDLQDRIQRLDDMIDEARELEWDPESKKPSKCNPDDLPRDDKFPGDGTFSYVTLGNSPFDWKIRVECPGRKSFRAALKQCDARAGTFRCRSKQTGELCVGKVRSSHDEGDSEATATVALE